MIKLSIYDIKNRKKFIIETTYEDTIKRMKKYTHSNNIFIYGYEYLSTYSNYEQCQVSYWYFRQYRQIK